MHVFPRLRLELARRPWLYWSAVAACALIVWSSVAGAIASADHRRQQWGTGRTVMVATHSVSGGEPLVAVRRDYPEAMVPDAALDTLPTGAVAAHAVTVGEVITRADVAGERAPPSSWVVFGMTGRRPRLAPGDSVAVFGDGVLHCDGIVIGVSDRQTDVAVPPSCAAAVSMAVSEESIVLARSKLS